MSENKQTISSKTEKGASAALSKMLRAGHWNDGDMSIDCVCDDTKKSDTCCQACGVAWVEHQGIFETCRKLQCAMGALQAIYTWSTFRGGELLTPKGTETVCAIALNMSEKRKKKQ